MKKPVKAKKAKVMTKMSVVKTNIAKKSTASIKTAPLKNYVVSAIFLAVLGVLSLFFGAFYLISARLNSYGIATLPETGEEIYYYSQCVLSHRSSEIVKCAYNVNAKNGEYQYEDEKNYYDCTVNDGLMVNVCSAEISK